MGCEALGAMAIPNRGSLVAWTRSTAPRPMAHALGQRYTAMRARHHTGTGLETAGRRLGSMNMHPSH